MGITPFIFAGMNIYFDGFPVWVSASVPRWVLRLLIAFLAIVWIMVTGTLWLTPCPR